MTEVPATNDERKIKNKRGLIVLISLYVLSGLGSICFCYSIFNFPRLSQFWRAKFTAEGKIGTTLFEDAGDWLVIASEDFEDDKSGWQVGRESKDYAEIERSIENGVYTIEVTTEEGANCWQTPNVRPVRDFYFTVDGDQTSGSPRGDYGVIFRKVGSDFYIFTLSDYGLYSVRIFSDGEWESIKTGFYLPAEEGESLRNITIIAQGPDFYLFIDDAFFIHFEDNRLKRGKVGFFFSLNNPGDQGVFEYDNFELREPDD
jgi:hypothetical protein